VGEVLGNDACAGLLFLLDVVVAVFGLFSRGRLVAGKLVNALSGSNVDGVGSELGVVEEKGCLSSPVGFTLIDWIFPQKLKKLLISSSLVFMEMFSTLTVAAMVMDMLWLERYQVIVGSSWKGVWKVRL
jgi:hypothetical protein